MKHNVMLTIASLLSILFFTLHLADDIMRGTVPGRASIFLAVPTLVTWLYGTLVLAERRSGYVVTLVGSLLAASVPFIHSMGPGGIAGEIANSSGALFYVWTLLALGVTAVFSVLLSARGLWGMLRDAA